MLCSATCVLPTAPCISHQLFPSPAFASLPQLCLLASLWLAAEKLVLAANGRGGVAVCALRPSGIFGEYDTLLVATTVRNAARGKLKYIIGNGRNEMDWTYAGNVAQVGLL
jgi:nucleoside-diphosphate-sugar epimerase